MIEKINEICLQLDQSNNSIQIGITLLDRILITNLLHDIKSNSLPYVAALILIASKFFELDFNLVFIKDILQ